MSLEELVTKEWNCAQLRCTIPFPVDGEPCLSWSRVVPTWVLPASITASMLWVAGMKHWVHWRLWKSTVQRRYICANYTEPAVEVWLIEINANSFTVSVQEKWVEVAPMSTARAGVSVSAVNGLLYAVGGRAASRDFSAPVTVDSVEIYDPHLDTWNEVGNMITSRCDGGLAVL